MPTLGILASARSRNLVPNAPTIGTATNTPSNRPYNNGAASVTFTPAASGPTATSYTVTSSPGGYTTNAASSPITVTGLQSGTAYTFTVIANNALGSSVASSASNSITATTVPQAPTIGTVSRTSDTVVSVPYTDNATGGSAITSRTITSSPSLSLSYSTTSSSPVAVTATYTGNQAYTFTITATNANGTSSSSGTSNSVIPYTPPPPPTISNLTFNYGGGSTATLTWTATNQSSYLFTSNYPGTYPSPYNYGTYTSSWPGNLVNIDYNVVVGIFTPAYTFTITVSNSAGATASQTITVP
jgi:hypothetical protein